MAENDIIKAFKEAQIFRGSLAERKTKLLAIHYSIPVMFKRGATLDLDGVTLDEYEAGSTAKSFYSPTEKKIVLVGHLSIMTYLHELAHASGITDEAEARRWSHTIFRACYPKSYERLSVSGEAEELAVYDNSKKRRGKTPLLFERGAEARVSLWERLFGWASLTKLIARLVDKELKRRLAELTNELKK